MDAVAFGEDVRLHGRVPFVGTVPKMHAALQKRLHGDKSHTIQFSLRFSSASFNPGENRVCGTPRPVRKRVGYWLPKGSRLYRHKLSRLRRERTQVYHREKDFGRGSLCGRIHSMNQEALQQALDGLPLGGVRYFDRIDSTNNEAAFWADTGAADFSLVAADEQTAGRGRQGRKWFTPPGAALAFSLVLKDAPPAENLPAPQFISRLTALGALAVSEALRQEYRLAAEIKWPNDVLLGRRKVAGVLAEAHWLGDQLSAVILGIGVNVTAQSVPPEGEAVFPAGCIEAALGAPVERWELLRAILGHLAAWRQRLGSAAFMPAWEERLAFRGEWVRLAGSAELQSAQAGEALVLGLDAQGRLRVRDRQGAEFALQTGEVRIQKL